MSSVISRQDILGMVRGRRPGYSLEAPFYTSRDVFELDLEAVFGRHWIFVGSEPEVPEPGDYVTVDLGRWSVIVLRDDDENVRAFHNVCRHRGSRLLAAQSGSTGNLVCPYHSWTYDTGGRLVHAESVGPGFEAGCFSLKPVHLKSISGLLFICLADEPPEDIDEVAAVVEPYLDPHGLRECKVARQIDIVEDGNWKLVMENNRECYHCGGHPELGFSLFPTIGYAEEDIGPSRRAAYDRFKRIDAEMTAIWERGGLPWRQVLRLAGRPTGFLVERTPLDRDGESITADTRVASQRLLGDFTSPRLGRQGLHLQPNSWHHFLSDHVVTFAVLPLEPGRTLLRTTWLVHKDAVEGVDYDPEKLVSVWRTTNAQDAAFVAGAHKGVSNPAYEPGPFSPTESWVEHFCAWYLERLDAHLGGQP
ncbi:aromatic ring-hydroxylating dioxygenase subunit alpha [Actinacidiphila oryziradicis]|jgi:Rieske 2Fe-2S family protein|uniref:aromatic ring-hydroxylating oxygenase subunit alpha n=1 Tax=Actinacidiphila oryziradicis TaxID=2571141 RepID=UPI0023F47B98|nr:aromatic ring-hydroxylating dioxygenase subunit alpha [Actinacidiphila oryziradicis]MCW2869870.1 Rieske (2Fe-2S) iron-sulfur protein [Actinacidiphila oryziradicis]